MMDLYSRRRTDWIAKSKSGEAGGDVVAKQAPVTGTPRRGFEPASSTKSGIELAREKFAASRAKSAQKSNGKGAGRTGGTGANSVVSRISAA